MFNIYGRFPLKSMAWVRRARRRTQTGNFWTHLVYPGSAATPYNGLFPVLLYYILARGIISFLGANPLAGLIVALCIKEGGNG